MAEAKRKPVAKKLADVQRPDTTAADSTGKPIILTNRQIIRDPMVTTEATSPILETKSAPALPKNVPVPNATPAIVEAAPAEEAVEEVQQTEPVVVKRSMVIEPLTAAEPEPEAEESAEDPATEPTEPTEADQPEIKPASTEKVKTEIPSAETNVKAAEDAASEAEAKRQAELQKLADNKQYFLTIDAVKQRRAQQFIVFGILTSIILALAWLNIALDAGLIKINSIKPVTNFFSATEPVTTSAEPASDETTYREAGSKIQLTYPKTWKQSLGAQNAKDVTFYPSTAATLGVVTVDFKRSPEAPANGSITISYTNFEPVRINGKPFTLRQIVYYNSISSKKYQVIRVDLTNSDSSLAVGQTVNSLNAPITLADGSTASLFSIILSDGDKPYATIEEAKKFFDSDDYKAIRSILLSLKY